MNMPGLYTRTTTEKKMSSHVGSLTLEGGYCETENELFWVRIYLIKFLLTSKRERINRNNRNSPKAQ